MHRNVCWSPASPDNWGCTATNPISMGTQFLLWTSTPIYVSIRDTYTITWQENIPVLQKLENSPSQHLFGVHVCVGGEGLHYVKPAQLCTYQCIAPGTTPWAMGGDLIHMKSPLGQMLISNVPIRTVLLPIFCKYWSNHPDPGHIYWSKYDQIPTFWQ